MPGRGSDSRPRDQENGHHIREGKPVEVLRVENADEEVGERVDVEDDPLLSAGQAGGIRLDDHRAGLGEGERNHREGDACNPQAHRAEHERHGDRDDSEQRERCGKAPLPLRERNGGHVDAEREVEGVPEREEPGEAEQEVVRERNPGEDETQREQLERTGRVEGARKHPR